MKKYNMIENRKDLTREEVQEGMDFNKILLNSNTNKKNYWKPAIILFSIITVTLIGLLGFFNIDSIENNSEIKTEPVILIPTHTEPVAAETYSLFFGNKLAIGELSLSKEEISNIKSLDLKSSIANSKCKLISFTFTTLTKNGISQINVNGGLFNAEVKDLLKSLKTGQTLYFENIIVQDQNGINNSVQPITVSIK
jgi:hypothetical protein